MPEVEAKEWRKKSFAVRYLANSRAGSFSGGRSGNDDITNFETMFVRPPYVSIPITRPMVSLSPGMPAESERVFRRTQTSREQESDDRSGCPDDESAGNPVVLYTGNKTESELDFASHGEMGLFLQRTYNHHWSATGIFGGHWISNFDYSLAFSAAGAIAWVQYPDGRRIKFLRVGGTDRWNEDKPGPVAYLLRDSDSSYTVHNEGGGSETFNADGYVTRLMNEQGVAWDFTYSDKYLQQVTHSSGRSVRFTWTNGQLSQVTDPAGAIYRYTYTGNVFGSGQSRLASTTLPGQPDTVLTYHYEDPRHPGGLTGKSINGTRYSTFAYDANRRTVLTEHHGGVERHEFRYNVESSQPVRRPPAPARPGGALQGEAPGWCEHGPDGRICYVPWSLPGGEVALRNATVQRPVKMSVTVTNPLGRSTTHRFEDGRKLSVQGTASPLCAGSYKEQTYDANGNPDLVHDFANSLTDFDYNAEGQRIRMAEAAGTPEQRVTTYTWDSTHNRLLTERIEGEREIVYGYDPRGRVSSEIVRDLSGAATAGASEMRTTIAYSYHSNNITATATVDGPLPQDSVTLSFNPQGDLVSVTDGLGHSTAYAGHNGRGQPGTITGSNGDVLELTYDTRGRVVSRRQRDGSLSATTAITYNGPGMVSSVTGPDGNVVHYGYDAALRRVSETVPLKDGTYRWTRYSHDAASNLTRSQVTQTDYPFGTSVTGRVEGVTHDAAWQWSVVGWACTTGSSKSITVQANVESGQALATGTANLASEQAVGHACQSGGSAHRFALPITVAQRQQFGGQRIVVQGVSPQGVSHNVMLDGSSAHAVPTAPVTGDVLGVTRDGEWNYFVEGWACSIGVNSPIDVHIYMGGPAGSGTGVASGRADHATGPDIANACQAQGTAYRFRVHLNDHIRTNHANQGIHVHAISPAGGANLVIGNAGTYSAPAIVRTADFISFAPSPSLIYNGEQSVLTAHLRNTGNVVWHGDTYLAWGRHAFTDHQLLPHSVHPGQDVVIRWPVSPTHPGSGVTRIMYMSTLSRGGVAWGPRGNTAVEVENRRPICRPGNPACTVPWDVPQEGAP
ncbi:DUF6531 domain-containing protein [Stenotrophomonas sp. VV52]|uniref:DUF6531 domain-containing protein n=1 Tax=Stenotrophomonas sp. VV52 TaxID=2066958 RepID=UPI001C0F08D1|nr:DUF6531 domain-containing protein [Stenotrophomonas sp. VV52]